jgi:hypothetical protein
MTVAEKKEKLKVCTTQWQYTVHTLILQQG